MDSGGADAARVLGEIDALKEAKSDIEAKISALEAQLKGSSCPRSGAISSNGSCPAAATVDEPGLGHGLSPEMIHRYSRQLLLPSFGVQAQSNLLKSSILVVGAGGLGSPTLLYLAACGVGRLGIVDNAVVELNNMHRQIIHTEAYVGRSKVESAAAACRAINSTVQIVEHREALRASNALEILSKYAGSDQDQ